MPTLNPSITLPIPLLGVLADLDPRKIPPEGLFEAENRVCRDGQFVGRDGLVTFGASVSERPMGLAQYDHPSEDRRLVLGTVARWLRWDKGTTAWVEVSDPANRLTGVDSSQVVFRFFQNEAGVKYLLGCNAVDKAKKWDGDVAHSYADIGGQTRIPRCMAVAADHLLMGGFLDGDQDVEWSNNLDFDSGYSSPGHGKNLGDTSGGIIALQELGAYNLAGYKEDAVYLAVAEPSEATFFHWSPKFLGIPGPVSPLAVVPLPSGEHAILASDGAVYRFSGSSYESAGSHIQRFISDNWHFASREQSWGFYDQTRRELWFIYPHKATTELSHAICLSLPSWSLYPMRWAVLRMSAGGHVATAQELAFGEVELPFGDSPLTFGETSQDRLATLFCATIGQVCEASGHDDLGGAIPMVWEYGLGDAGSFQSWKTVVSMDHAFDRTVASQVVSVRIAYSRNGEARSLSEARTFDLVSTAPLRTGHRVSGRLLSARYEIGGTQAVEFSGAEVGYAVRGLR